MRSLRSLAWPGALLALTASAAGADVSAPAVSADRREVPRGQAVTPIRSVAKPEQSYALYLPSGYAAERKWPIVYVFDPAAQGMRPLELMKGAAERHGYIVAASNNSRNGPWQVSQEAAAELWDDTHRWLAIDDRRVYFAGFSGGARVAATLAQACRCARGVFLVGAGFNAGSPPSREAAFSVFGLTGLSDFNYGELVDLDAELERLGFRHTLKRFDGGHVWAPASEWDDALAWSALAEMKDGVRARDDSFAASELAKAMERGRGHEQAGEALVALGGYRAAVAVLDGLVDTAALSARIEGLLKDASVRSAVERERSELARQRSLEGEILGPMNSLRDAGGERITLQAEVAIRIRRLRAELQAEQRPERRRVLLRVVGSAHAVAMPAGWSLLDAGSARLALAFFELAAEARPELAGPHLALANCRAVLRDEKAALRALKGALAAGLDAGHLAASVAGDPRLAALARTEGYRKLLASAPPDRLDEGPAR